MCQCAAVMKRQMKVSTVTRLVRYGTICCATERAFCGRSLVHCSVNMIFFGLLFEENGRVIYMSE
jgi:hypothetical protein